MAIAQAEKPATSASNPPRTAVYRVNTLSSRAQPAAEEAAERRALLMTLLAIEERYTEMVLLLNPYNQRHRPIIARILWAVGARVFVGRNDDGEMTLSVELTFPSETALLWFRPGGLPEEEVAAQCPITGEPGKRRSLPPLDISFG
jgi:hypothetical protein